MLLGISGTCCSGKKTLIAYLTEKYGFTQLFINESEGPNNFDCLKSAVNHATTNWVDRHLISNIDRYDAVDVAFKRPFFLLLYIDAPITVRYERFLQNKLHSIFGPLSIDQASSLPLERFINLDEDRLYKKAGLYSVHEISQRAQVRLLNASNSLQTLHSQVDKLDLLNPELTRPSWDTYFMALCELASQRSNCMKRRVGCILVSECRVIATGYNGTPRNVLNCNQGGCPRCNNNASCGSSLDQCICIHAEENSLLEAGRERIANRDVTLYCTTCPCLGCAKKIIQVGISKVVYAHDYGMDELTAKLFKQAGIEIRQVPTQSINFVSNLNSSDQLIKVMR